MQFAFLPSCGKWTNCALLCCIIAVESNIRVCLSLSSIMWNVSQAHISFPKLNSRPPKAWIWQEYAREGSIVLLKAWFTQVNACEGAFVQLDYTSILLGKLYICWLIFPLIFPLIVPTSRWLPAAKFTKITVSLMAYSAFKISYA